MPDIITCQSCDKETYANQQHCPHCGVKFDTQKNFDKSILPLSVPFNRTLFWFVFVVSSISLTFFGFKIFIDFLLLIDSAPYHGVRGVVWILGLSVFGLWYSIRKLRRGKVALCVHENGIEFPAQNTSIIPWGSMHVSVEQGKLHISSRELKKGFQLKASDIRLRLHYLVDLISWLQGRVADARQSGAVSIALGQKEEKELNPGNEDILYNEFQSVFLLVFFLGSAVGLMIYYFFFFTDS